MTKKGLALALAALLMVLAAGCGKSAGDPNAPQTNTAASNGSSSSSGSSSGSGNSSGTVTQPPQQSFFAPEPTKTAPVEKANLGPLQLAAPAKVGPLTVTVTEKAVVTKAPGLPPNYAYVVMNVTVKNDSKDDYTINTADHFKLETPEAKPMPLNVQASAQRNPRLQGTLEPGSTKQGWLGYLVKVQGGTFKYKFTHPDYGDAYWEFAIQ